MVSSPHWAVELGCRTRLRAESLAVTFILFFMLNPSLCSAAPPPCYSCFDLVWTSRSTSSSHVLRTAAAHLLKHLLWTFPWRQTEPWESRQVIQSWLSEGFSAAPECNLMFLTSTHSRSGNPEAGGRFMKRSCSVSWSGICNVEYLSFVFISG